ncbi:MAG: hypothetical protein ACLQQ4_12630 [Bacteroidia bacterium]
MKKKKNKTPREQLDEMLDDKTNKQEEKPENGSGKVEEFSSEELNKRLKKPAADTDGLQSSETEL